MDRPAGQRGPSGRVEPVGNTARRPFFSAFGHRGTRTSGHHRAGGAVRPRQRAQPPHRLPLQRHAQSLEGPTRGAACAGQLVPQCARRIERQRGLRPNVCVVRHGQLGPLPAGSGRIPLRHGRPVLGPGRAPPPGWFAGCCARRSPEEGRLRRLGRRCARRRRAG